MMEKIFLIVIHSRIDLNKDLKRIAFRSFEVYVLFKNMYKREVKEYNNTLLILSMKS